MSHRNSTIDKAATRLYEDRLSLCNKMMRLSWQIARALFFVPFPGPAFKRWRILILRVFGATIGRGCRVDSSCRIWWPGNLTMGNYACLAGSVDCYNVASITIGDYATVSQRAFLCSASHATDTLAHTLISAPISIEPHAWVCAETFLGPGVTVKEGAILGARSVAVRDLESWTIYTGNPARALKPRRIVR